MSALFIKQAPFFFLTCLWIWYANGPNRFIILPPMWLLLNCLNRIRKIQILFQRTLV